LPALAARVCDKMEVNPDQIQNVQRIADTEIIMIKILQDIRCTAIQKLNSFRDTRDHLSHTKFG